MMCRSQDGDCLWRCNDQAGTWETSGVLIMFWVLIWCVQFKKIHWAVHVWYVSFSVCFTSMKSLKKLDFFVAQYRKSHVFFQAFQVFIGYEFRCHSREPGWCCSLMWRQSEMRRHPCGWGRLVFSWGPLRASTDGQACGHLCFCHTQ